jgi:hypothetical protein
MPESKKGEGAKALEYLLPLPWPEEEASLPPHFQGQN